MGNDLLEFASGRILYTYTKGTEATQLIEVDIFFPVFKKFWTKVCPSLKSWHGKRFELNVN